MPENHGGILIVDDEAPVLDVLSEYVATPFDFRYLDRAVSAGLVQAAGAASGRSAGAAHRLTELELALAAAAELGDPPLGERSGIEAAVGAARKTLRAG